MKKFIERAPVEGVSGLRNMLPPIVVALLLWVATFPNIWTVFGGLNKHVLAAKAIQLLLLLVLCCGVYLAWRRRDSPKVREFCRCFGAQLLVFVAVLVLIWPGGWRWDDLGTLDECISNANWPTWQHYFTSLYYMICMITVPIPGFIVLVEVAVISLINATVAQRLAGMVGAKARPVLLAALALLPPVLNMSLYPLRNAIHAELLLLMLVLLAEMRVRDVELTWPRLALFSLLVAVVASWRSECVVYLAFVPVLLLALGKRGQRLKNAALVAVLSAALTFAFGAVQKYADNSDNGASDDYLLTAYVPSLPAFVHEARESGDEAFLGQMAECFDNDVLARAYDEGVSGEEMFWRQDVWPFLRPELRDSADYGRKVTSVFVEGVKRYPLAFLKTRWDQFVLHSGSRWSPYQTHDLWVSIEAPGKGKLKEFAMSKTPFPRAREVVTSYMEALGGFGWLSWTYNLFVPLACLLGWAVFLAVRRSPLALLPLALVLHNVVVFLTAPTFYFMYYYSLYLGGLVGLVMVAVLLWRRLRRRGTDVAPDVPAEGAGLTRGESRP